MRRQRHFSLCNISGGSVFHNMFRILNFVGFHLFGYFLSFMVDFSSDFILFIVV